MINNIFAGKRQGVWSLQWKRHFNPEEVEGLIKAKVVQGQYGLSVEFLFPDTTLYMDLAKNSPLEEGDELDIDESLVICLKKDDQEIIRVLGL